MQEITCGKLIGHVTTGHVTGDVTLSEWSRL